jgi:hypothetical protein
VLRKKALVQGPLTGLLYQPLMTDVYEILVGLSVAKETPVHVVHQKPHTHHVQGSNTCLYGKKLSSNCRCCDKNAQRL